MKFTIVAIVLAFVLVANAHVVVDVAKFHSGAGSHGPALVNTHGGYDGGYNGGYAGYSGYSAGHGWNVGHPNGAPHITLHTTGYGYGGDGAGYAGAGYSGAGYAGHGHDGQYVAANRGAVHVAPLVGHIQSVKSTNDQPAPGTTW